MMKVLLFFTLLGCSQAFFGAKPATGGGGKLASSPPQADAAIEIFAKKYPFNRPPPKKSSFVNFGMPVQDVDGSPVYKKYDSPRRLTDISESKARANFAELAKNYGTDAALDMVRTMPLILSFNKSNIGPTLDNFAEIFGREEAQAMVQRNPGLLAIKPIDAATANDQTMVFSYIVGATRPVGSILLASIFLALLSLPVEAATGISFRAEFMAAVFGQ